MTSSPDHRRRTRVVVGLLVGAAIVLAACSGDEGDGEAAPTTPATDEELTDTTPSASAAELRRRPSR